MKTPKSICVVGGGSSGLIAAMILKQRFNMPVMIVRSKNIGTIGVGEGSTEHWKEFMDFIGLDQYELIKETNATYKAGLMFENWRSDEKPFFHAVGSVFATRYSQYKYVYANQIAKNDSYLQYDYFWKNYLPKHFLGKSTEWPVNQFHFDTNKLNDYLTSKAEKMGIDFFDDEIEKINFDDQGYIESLKGKKYTYEYDFYIDCTGFKRLLIDQMGAKWQSYSNFLKMNSAIVFPTGDEENYNIWSLSKALDAGWRFKLPTYGRHGNGYIFDSNYINADQAKEEIEKDLGHEVDIKKHIKFDTGAIDKPWIKNCVAIGLSCNFLEPLEASSIGTSLQQSFILMHKLINYNDQIINDYNKSINDITDNARDFVSLHYMTDKKNTDFWVDAGNNEIPDSLAEKLEVWKYKLPIVEDFNHLSDYVLFSASNYIMIMEGLNLFDRESIKRELEMHNPSVKNSTENLIQQEKDWEKSLELITHKEFLKAVRDYY